MMVASLEALAPRDSGSLLPWDALDQRKRDVIDPTLVGLDDDVRAKVQAAILEAERAGARRRFIDFVLSHLTPYYFREGAVEAIRPMSAFDLRKALGRAYNIRSSNVHELQNLRPETWAFGDGAESVDPAGQGLMLSIEGLNRLSHCVIREFVRRASTEDVEPFEYRSAIPGILQVQLAPQLWVSSADGFSKDSAGRYFEGVVDVLLEALRPTRGNYADNTGATRPIEADLREICSRIEVLAPSLQGGPRLSMIAIYYLWNRFIVPEKAMPDAESFVEKYVPELEAPSMQSFVVACVTGEEPPWATAEFEHLVANNVVSRPNARTDPLPNLFRAALAAEAAKHLALDGRRDDAIAMIATAVEELPGNRVLIEAESNYAAGQSLSVDLRELLFGPEHD
ncbi:hypothetical protein H7J86_20990 [Mycobacterium hackensackense]|uniref:hypothetical protein n=1 Tax=Mycobacterium hackensackense TaxID=228909 RepID=UPI00226595F3|nr:hypothetical protein [Mycobacterium hackensackense]MCV7254643.1 hypothetical protein [Mycobacterium hackensackense]